MFNNVSVIIPIVREDKAKKAIAAVKVNCPGVELIAEKDVDGIGCPKMVKKLTAKTTREWVMFLGDDTEIQPGALQAALDAAERLPNGFGMVGLNTENSKPYAHWLISKGMLALTDGEFFSTEYKHCFCDDELKDIATDHNRFVFAENAHVKHDHPVSGAESDEFYQKAYDTFREDQKTYFRRKRERYGNKLAIGFPLVDATVPVQFFTSFACMDKTSQYTLLTPEFPHGPWAASIADARNSLVEQALRDGARYLLMLDTDQVYPHDTLTKLMSHNVDVCGVRVHRRWMPFDPIFLRGELGAYQSVDDDEMYSGDLIEVDATGSGCLLFNMEVFDRVPTPWFEFSKTPDGKPIGEDINFCSKARIAGIKIHIDTSIAVGHLATIEINEVLHKLCKHLTPNLP